MSIPFASPRLLWRTHREKDASDLVFLRQWFSERGEEPPECMRKRFLAAYLIRDRCCVRTWYSGWVVRTRMATSPLFSG